MKKRQQLKLETLARIPSFLDDYALELGNLNRSPSRLAVDTLVRELTTTATSQAVAAADLRSCATRKEVLRRDLRTRYLRPIAAIARVELACSHVATAFTCPPIKARDDVFLAQAESVGEQAAKHRYVFVRHRLPGDFLPQMRGMINAIDQEIDQSDACMKRQTAATAALVAAFRRAARVVAMLDALVKARAGGNLGLVALWNAVRRGQLIDARRDGRAANAA